MPRKIKIHREGGHRKGYTRKDGTQVAPASVAPSTFMAEDRGKPGKTPPSEQWYNPEVKMDWHKDMSMQERRKNALKTHNGDELATARALQALANVTTDVETSRAAQEDARYFYQHHKPKERRPKPTRFSMPHGGKPQHHGGIVQHSGHIHRQRRGSIV